MRLLIMSLDFTKMKSRDDLGAFLNGYGLTGMMVEVGSFFGEYARTVISKWRGRYLYMIDPWEKQPDNVYREPINDSKWEDCMASCKKLVNDYCPRVVMMQLYSPAAANSFLDGELDCVYLDGRHDLEAVRADLRAWWPKVKTGGVFGGHDFRVEHNETQCCDVQTAVEEFSKEIGAKPHITTAPGCYSWWFEKT